MSSLQLVFLATILIPAADGSGADLDHLNGSWRVVAIERDGLPLKAPEQVMWVFSDKDLSIVIAGKVKSKDSITQAPAITPKALNRYVTTAIDGDLILSTVKAIYRMDGDMLFACFGEPNEDRPTEFAPRPGSRTTLVVLKRVRR